MTANGYNRSAACIMLYLQRAEDAKRCYAKVLNTHISTYGNRLNTYLECSKSSFTKLLQTAYKDSGVDPSDLAYLEAEGSGCKVSAKISFSLESLFLLCNKCVVFCDEC